MHKLSVPMEMFIGMILSLIVAITFYSLHNRYEIEILLWIVRVSFALFLQFVTMYISAPIVYCFFDNRINPDSFWFRKYGFEDKLYKDLHVKKWKKFVLSYDENQFSLNQLSKTVLNMCHNELVHEFSAILGFLPILLCFFYGNAVFWILSSLFFFFIHIGFAVIQRYNRPRVLKILEKKN